MSKSRPKLYLWMFLFGLFVVLLASCFVFGLWAIVYFAVLFLCLEVFFACTLRERTKRLKQSPVSELGKRVLGYDCTVKDPELGLLPPPNVDAIGEFVTPDGSRSRTYHIRTSEEGFRVTGEGDRAALPRILVLGCSFVFGTGVDDEQTFCWKLQQAMPDYNVVNLGIPSGSPYQSLLLLQRMLKHHLNIAGVVFGYQPTLDKRNYPILGELPWFVGPYCVSRYEKRAKKQRLYEYPVRKIFRIWGSQRVNFLKGLETWVNDPDYVVRGDKVWGQTMKHLLLKMQQLCADNSVPFLFAGLVRFNPHIQLLSDERFSFCNVSFDDREKRKDGSYRWSLLPFDKHPSEEAHSVYSEMIEDALRRVLDGEVVVPSSEILSVVRNLGVRPSEISDFMYPMW